MLYRSRPAFRIVPGDGPVALGALEEDSLYLAEAAGSSNDGWAAADHERLLYRTWDASA